MKALFKDSDRLLIKDLKRDEKVIMDNFVKLFRDYEVKVTELMNIDNELDGMTFTITDKPKAVIRHNEIYTQMLYANTSLRVDLGVDRYTDIEILNNQPDRIETTLEGTVITINALQVTGLKKSIGHYLIYAVLNRPGCDQTTVPIEIYVFYKSGSYKDLDDIPKINNVSVIDDKSLDDYNIQEKMDEISNQELEDIIGNIF